MSSLSDLKFIDVDGTELEIDDFENHYVFSFEGKKHRIGGPAVVYPGIRYEWYLHGKRDRKNDPAMIDYSRGSFRAWYRNDQLHREDGPARILWSGEEYWMYGTHMTKTLFICRQPNVSVQDLLKLLMTPEGLEIIHLKAIKKALGFRGKSEEEIEDLVSAAKFAAHLI